MMPETDELTKLLSDGWVIAGYSVCMLAAGALSHNILLQKNNSLASITVLVNAGREIGRNTTILAPVAVSAPKKGFFS